MQAGNVITVSIGHLIHDLYLGFLPALLPVLIVHFGITNAQAGLLTVFLQLPSLLQPLIGVMADRFSLRYVFAFAPGMTAILMSLSGLAPSYGVLAILLVVAGFSNAAMHAIGSSMAGAMSGRRLGRGLGIWMVGGSFGFALGALVIVSVVQLAGLRGTVWTVFPGLLISLILFLRLRALQWRPPRRAAGGPGWKTVLLMMAPIMVPVCMVLALRSAMEAALSTYLPTYIDSETGNLWLAGISLSVAEGAGVVGTLAMGNWSDRVGRRRVLIALMGVTPIFLLMFLYTSGLVQLAVLALLGFSTFSILPVLMAVVQESYPENRALANGIFLATNFVLKSFVAVGLGAFADGFGLRSIYYIAGVAALLALPLLARLPGGGADRASPAPA